MSEEWQKMFVSEVPLWTIIVRGSIIYLSLFTLLRVVLKRESGQVSITDLLVIVLIADAAQNAMSNEYKSITAGVVLVATIIVWSYILDWLAFHVPFMERLLKPRSLPIIENGKMLRKTMRRELITEEELMMRIREEGVEDIAEVKAAFMESDGNLSVIKKDEAESGSGGGSGGKRKGAL
jgi:uncharacterized membrane protein YcaP (DUF421 family)